MSSRLLLTKNIWMILSACLLALLIVSWFRLNQSEHYVGIPFGNAFDGSYAVHEARPLKHAEHSDSWTAAEDSLLILYNRVPKTGSTTFANIAYKLTTQNGFHMLHINTTHKNDHFLNVVDQYRLIRNMSTWREKKPAIYHGHIQFIDFTRFGYTNPIYINIVRDPMERLISYYYFLRNGDDYRPQVKRHSADDAATFDECVEGGGKDCNPERVLWVQVPFFCGQSAQCQEPGQWAVEQAKRNLVNHYLLVGITDQLQEFIALLETMLPRYFEGAYDLYLNGSMSHLRRTKGKISPQEATLKKVRESRVWQLEQEFYMFAKRQFEFLKSRTLSYDSLGRLVVSLPQFKYEKIMPDLPKTVTRL